MELFTGSVDIESYIDSMEALSQMARRLHAIYQSRAYLQGMKKQKIYQIVHSRNVIVILDGIKNFIANKVNGVRLKQRTVPFKREITRMSEPNYFSEHRIAVYTCVFGQYDQVQEPVCHPKNIDYFIITDMDMPKTSAWKKINLTPYQDDLRGLSNVEKNRWFKMHPDKVFVEYEYSVYVDGNVVPVTDFTEFINRISDCGIAMYWHSYNNCVYQEGLYNQYFVRKVAKRELEKHVKHLEEVGMPKNYGMTTCNVIARQHNNPVCTRLMDDWWNEFMTHCRRDQMSFPYAAWKNGIEMGDIARLGSDVWNSGALLVSLHKD